MQRRIGPLLILSSCIFTWIVWSFVEPTKTVSIFREYSQLAASILLVVLAWVNFISTRHWLIDTFFHGLDKSYLYHKYLSIFAVVLIWVHEATIDLGKIRKIKSMATEATGLLASINWTAIGKGAASLSMLLFTIFVIFALLAVKLDYQKWKILHKLMILPFILGIVHYYASAEYPVFAVNPYSLWMNLVILIGFLSIVYSIFLYEKVSFKYKYKVSGLKAVAKNTLEISATPLGAQMQYKPGQFAFLKIAGKEEAFPSHPFSLSQAPAPGQIQFTIKAIGDHTDRIRKVLNEGDIIAVSGPHGKFDYQSGAKRQLWIAGGIGITPFRSFYQSKIPAEYSIDFFYAYENEQEGAYADELSQLKPRENLRIHLINSSKIGFLTMEKLATVLDNATPFDIYFCGPKGMREKFKKEFAQSHYLMKAFHHEEFQFK